VLCVGGAGAKADPTRLRFVDLIDASMDPLVRTVRHQLRTKFNVTTGIDCLLSMEKPRCGLVTTEEQASAPSMLDYQVHFFLYHCMSSMLYLDSHLHVHSTILFDR
jgi:tRNA threonylcarbamoyladenosine dehydratase